MTTEEKQMVPQSDDTISDDYLVRLAKDPDVTPDTLRAFMDLRDREQLRRAKQAYALSMTQFRALCPNIVKTKEVDFSTKAGRTRYNYAGLAETLAAINTALASCNLSPSWRTDIEQPIVKVTCVMLHADGHSETTTMVGPFDTTGNKNQIQSIGSTVTYLERYTLFALLGLASIGQDDDGQANAPTPAMPVAEPQRASNPRATEKEEKDAFKAVANKKSDEETLSRDTLRSVLIQVQAFSHLESIPDCTRWLDQHAKIIEGRVEVVPIDDEPQPANTPENHRAELETICICCVAMKRIPITTDFKTFTLLAVDTPLDIDDVCKALSAFKGKEGNVVSGRGIADLSEKALAITLKKARTLESELEAVKQ